MEQEESSYDDKLIFGVEHCAGNFEEILQLYDFGAATEKDLKKRYKQLVAGNLAPPLAVFKSQKKQRKWAKKTRKLQAEVAQFNRIMNGKSNDHQEQEAVIIDEQQLQQQYQISLISAADQFALHRRCNTNKTRRNQVDKMIGALIQKEQATREIRARQTTLASSSNTASDCITISSSSEEEDVPVESEGDRVLQQQMLEQRGAIARVKEKRRLQKLRNKKKSKATQLQELMRLRRPAPPSSPPRPASPPPLYRDTTRSAITSDDSDSDESSSGSVIEIVSDSDESCGGESEQSHKTAPSSSTSSIPLHDAPQTSSFFHTLPPTGVVSSERFDSHTTRSNLQLNHTDPPQVNKPATLSSPPVSTVPCDVVFISSDEDEDLEMAGPEMSVTATPTPMSAEEDSFVDEPWEPDITALTPNTNALTLDTDALTPDTNAPTPGTTALTPEDDVIFIVDDDDEEEERVFVASADGERKRSEPDGGTFISLGTEEQEDEAAAEITIEADESFNDVDLLDFTATAIAAKMAVFESETASPEASEESENRHQAPSIERFDSFKDDNFIEPFHGGERIDDDKSLACPPITTTITPRASPSGSETDDSRPEVTIADSPESPAPEDQGVEIADGGAAEIGSVSQVGSEKYDLQPRKVSEEEQVAVEKSNCVFHKSSSESEESDVFVASANNADEQHQTEGSSQGSDTSRIDLTCDRDDGDEVSTTPENHSLFRDHLDVSSHKSADMADGETGGKMEISGATSVEAPPMPVYFPEAEQASSSGERDLPLASDSVPSSVADPEKNANDKDVLPEVPVECMDDAPAKSSPEPIEYFQLVSPVDRTSETAPEKSATPVKTSPTKKSAPVANDTPRKAPSRSKPKRPRRTMICSPIQRSSRPTEAKRSIFPDGRRRSSRNLTEVITISDDELPLVSSARKRAAEILLGEAVDEYECWCAKQRRHHLELHPEERRKVEAELVAAATTRVTTVAGRKRKRSGWQQGKRAKQRNTEAGNYLPYICIECDERFTMEVDCMIVASVSFFGHSWKAARRAFPFPKKVLDWEFPRRFRYLLKRFMEHSLDENGELDFDKSQRMYTITCDKFLAYYKRYYKLSPTVRHMRTYDEGAGDPFTGITDEDRADFPETVLHMEELQANQTKEVTQNLRFDAVIDPVVVAHHQIFGRLGSTSCWNELRRLDYCKRGITRSFVERRFWDLMRRGLIEQKWLTNRVCVRVTDQQFRHAVRVYKNSASFRNCE